MGAEAEGTSAAMKDTWLSVDLQGLAGGGATTAVGGNWPAARAHNDGGDATGLAGGGAAAAMCRTEAKAIRPLGSPRSNRILVRCSFF